MVWSAAILIFVSPFLNLFAVIEAQGLAGSSGRCPPAYVTIESPGMGTLHQTGTVSKGKKLVWHENTRM